MYKKILSHLEDFNLSSMDIETSALLSIDGLVMATTLPSHIDANHVSAICAGVFRLGHHTSEKCASGTLEQVTIKCTKNQITLIRASEESVLAVISKPHTNIEHLFPNIKNTIEKIILSQVDILCAA